MRWGLEPEKCSLWEQTLCLSNTPTPITLPLLMGSVSSHKAAQLSYTWQASLPRCFSCVLCLPKGTGASPSQFLMALGGWGWPVLSGGAGAQGLDLPSLLLYSGDRNALGHCLWPSDWDCKFLQDRDYSYSLLTFRANQCSWLTGSVQYPCLNF